MNGESCSVTGKKIYGTKELARNVRDAMRSHYKGRCSVQRCAFGDHYHVTKDLRGRKGKGDFR
jgi:hypothetical protein